MTDKAKPATFSERMDKLERALDDSRNENVELRGALESLVENFQQALYVQKEVIDVITGELDTRFPDLNSGPTEPGALGFKASISARLEQMKAAKLKRLADQESAQIKGFVEMGALEVATAIDLDSLVVGKPERAGVVLGSGRLTVEISNLDTSISDQLIGKEVGFLWTTPDGSTLEILEVYKKCPPKPVEAAADVAEVS